MKKYRGEFKIILNKAMAKVCGIVGISILMCNSDLGLSIITINLSPYGHLPAFLRRGFWMIDLVSNLPIESISRRRFEKF